MTANREQEGRVMLTLSLHFPRKSRRLVRCPMWMFKGCFADWTYQIGGIVVARPQMCQISSHCEKNLRTDMNALLCSGASPIQLQ